MVCASLTALKDEPHLTWHRTTTARETSYKIEKITVLNLEQHERDSQQPSPTINDNLSSSWVGVPVLFVQAFQALIKLTTGRMHSGGKGISASAIPYSRNVPAYVESPPTRKPSASIARHHDIAER
jgi:hypothetical protein